jgi:taurine dioxygenase
VLETRKIGAKFGAEINADLRTLSPDQFDELAELVVRHKLVAVRKQSLNYAELMAIAERLGRPLRSAFTDGVSGFPEIVEMVRRPDQKTALSTIWHSDSTYFLEPPSLTVLHGVVIPPFGGKTIFADTQSAYADLSPAYQALLRGLRVTCRSDLHSDNDRTVHVTRPRSGDIFVAEHPAVINHPETGALSLFVNEEHTAGFTELTKGESRSILQYLFTHMTRDEYCVDIEWEAGTVLIYDNRSLIHRAVNNCFGHERVLRRVLVQR